MSNIKTVVQVQVTFDHKYGGPFLATAVLFLKGKERRCLCITAAQ